MTNDPTSCPEAQSNSTISTKIALVDYSKTDDADYRSLTVACEGLDIGVLGSCFLICVYVWQV